MKEPNKPDAVSPAMALRFAIVRQWRRVTGALAATRRTLHDLKLEQ
jgi:hypothetical protein